MRRRFYEELEAGGLGIPEAVKRMRAITGLTQRDFAEQVAGISLPALQRIEQGNSNVRLDTLRKIACQFGLDLAFVRS